MTNNILALHAIGLDNLQISALDTDGSSNGSSATALANGADSGSLFITGVQDLAIETPDLRVVSSQGDDGALGQIEFPADTLAAGTMSFGAMNASAVALINDTLTMVDGGWSQVARTTGDGDRPQLFLIGNTKAQSVESGTYGEDGYLITHWWNITSFMKGNGGLANASPAVFSGSVNARLTSVTPWGLAVTTSNYGNARLYGVDFWSKYKWTTHSFIGDGAATSFTLDKTVAASDANTVQLWEDGVKQTYTTNYTATGTTFTLVGAARAAGVKCVVGYGYVD